MKGDINIPEHHGSFQICAAKQQVVEALKILKEKIMANTSI